MNAKNLRVIAGGKTDKRYGVFGVPFFYRIQGLVLHRVLFVFFLF